MKLRIIYTFSLLFFAGIILTSSSGGRANVSDAGNTGAPGDDNATCQTCHSSGSFSVTPELEIMDSGGNIITDNVNPGETYQVKLTVNSTGMPSGYGFQIVALNAPDGSNGDPVNTWVVPSSSTNVQVITTNSGRQYAEQKEAGASNEFIMEWTAPSATGDVTFYYGGNAVDGNSMTSGDNGIMGTTSVSLNSASLNALERKVNLDIYPNPVNEVINLRSNAQESNIYDLMLFDQNGKQVTIQKINIASGEMVSPIGVSHLATGIYSLVLSDGKNQITKKVVKL